MCCSFFSSRQIPRAKLQLQLPAGRSTSKMSRDRQRGLHMLILWHSSGKVHGSSAPCTQIYTPSNVEKACKITIKTIRIFQIQIQHGGQCRKSTTKNMRGAVQIKVKAKIPMLTVKILFSRKNKNRVDHRNCQAILKSHSKQMLELQGCEKVFASCLISSSFAYLSHLHMWSIYINKRTSN